MQTIAIAASTIASFILGGLWYSPILFGNIWAKEEKLNFEQAKARGITPYIYALISSLTTAIGFDYLVMHSTSLNNNLMVALIIGILFVAASLSSHYQFSGKSNTTFLIDAGYDVFRFIAYALIFWFIKY